jgi:hypothetical protein
MQRLQSDVPEGVGVERREALAMHPQPETQLPVFVVCDRGKIHRIRRVSFPVAVVPRPVPVRQLCAPQPQFSHSADLRDWRECPSPRREDH